MRQPEHPSGTAREALFDSAILNPTAVVMIGFGLESTHSNFPLFAFGVIAMGGLLAVAGSKRWQDFHEIRDKAQVD